MTILKEMKIAWKLMNANCEKCRHWTFWMDYGYGVCNISLEKSDEKDFCEDFEVDSSYYE